MICLFSFVYKNLVFVNKTSEFRDLFFYQSKSFLFLFFYKLSYLKENKKEQQNKIKICFFAKKKFK